MLSTSKQPQESDGHATLVMRYYRPHVPYLAVHVSDLFPYFQQQEKIAVGAVVSVFAPYTVWHPISVPKKAPTHTCRDTSLRPGVGGNKYQGTEKGLGSNPSSHNLFLPFFTFSCGFFSAFFHWGLSLWSGRLPLYSSISIGIEVTG